MTQHPSTVERRAPAAEGGGEDALEALLLATVRTTRQPFVVLEPDLTVRHANPAFLELFNPGEDETVGRPLFALGDGQWDIPELRRLLGGVLERQAEITDYRVEHHSETSGRRVMRVNARPLAVRGLAQRLLVAIEDVTEGERLQAELVARHEFTEKLIDSLREAVLVLTPELRVQTANQPFYDLFRVSPEATVGQPVYQLGNGQWDIPELRRLLEEILPAQSTFDDYEVEHDFEGIGWRLVSLNARRLDHLSLVLLAIRDLTGEAVSKRRLAASEERFRNLFETMQEGFMLGEVLPGTPAECPDFRFLELNAAMARFMGRPRAEVAGRTVRELFPTLSREDEAVLRRLCEVGLTGNPRILEDYLPVLDRWHRSYVYSPAPGQFAALQEDVSERKRVEQALQESEARFRTMADELPLLIWVHDAKGRQEFVNRTYLEYFGTTVEAIAEDRWQAFIHPEDADAYLGEFIACHHARRPFHAEVRVQDRHGQWRWLESWGRPRYSGAGDYRGLVGSSADVTERKRAETALTELKETLEARVAERSAQLAEERNFKDAILDTVTALIVIIDRRGRVVDFNRACELITGYAAKRVEEGLPVTDLVPAAERDAVRRLHERLWAGQNHAVHEHHWCRSDGTCFLVSWSYTLLRDRDGQVQYLIGTGVDITDQRQAEQEARRHLEEAARLQRLQTANELATLLAHELNQPLGAISMFAEASQTQLEAPEVDRQAVTANLQRISEQALRGGEIIRRLRSYVKQGRVDPRPLDLNAALTSVCGLMEHRAGAQGVVLDLHLDGSLPPVLAVAVHLDQVMLNLLRNAIEAIHDAGMAHGGVTVESAQEDGHARVTVRDTGPGLDTEALERIFDPLASSKDYGLGVGLGVSRSLIEAHGGRLWAEAREPGGVFHFTLPLAP